MKCIQKCSISALHQLTEKVQYFSMPKPDRTFQWLRDKSCMTWTTKLLIIPHTRRICRPPTTTFSSISTTPCARNTSKPKAMPKEPSTTSLLKELKIFMLQSQINLFLVGKDVLIPMMVILNYKDIFQLSYTILKLRLINLHFFAPT